MEFSAIAGSWLVIYVASAWVSTAPIVGVDDAADFWPDRAIFGSVDCQGPTYQAKNKNLIIECPDRSKVFPIFSKNGDRLVGELDGITYTLRSCGSRQHPC